MLGDETLDEFLTQIRLEDNFETYLMSILTHNLESILNETNNFKPVLNNFGQVSKTGQASPAFSAYDCESYNDKDLFKYLNQIWMWVLKNKMLALFLII